MAINPDYSETKVIETVAVAIRTFYEKLTAKLNELKIDKLTNKNPYLYRAKSIESAAEFIETALSAHISSSEETIFGNDFFEPIAIAVTGGQKSCAKGIDVEVQKEDRKFAIAVKSGKGILNANAQESQDRHFFNAGKLADQADLKFKGILGYSFGRLKSGKQGKPRHYEELAGQKFWSCLTGDDEFYLKLLDYMGDSPERFKADFDSAYEKAKNRLIRDFTNTFCQEDGSIDWKKLVEDSSKEEKPPTEKSPTEKPKRKKAPKNA